MVHQLQFIELISDEFPENRTDFFPTLDEAIDAHDEEFKQLEEDTKNPNPKIR
jgi:hypothetical protein